MPGETDDNGSFSTGRSRTPSEKTISKAAVSQDRKKKSEDTSENLELLHSAFLWNAPLAEAPHLALRPAQTTEAQGEPQRSRAMPQLLQTTEAVRHLIYRTGSLIWCNFCGCSAKKTNFGTRQGLFWQCLSGRGLQTPASSHKLPPPHKRVSEGLDSPVNRLDVQPPLEVSSARLRNTNLRRRSWREWTGGWGSRQSWSTCRSAIPMNRPVAEQLPSLVPMRGVPLCALWHLLSFSLRHHQAAECVVGFS